MRWKTGRKDVDLRRKEGRKRSYDTEERGWRESERKRGRKQGDRRCGSQVGS